MPYDGEFASYRPLRRLAESPSVQALLARQRIRDHSEGDPPPQTLPTTDLALSRWTPDWVLAIDGSHQPTRVENGFPGAEVGYVTVASVLLDLAKIARLDQQRPADPKEFRTTQHAESIDSALPGCNVVIDEHPTARASLRQTVFDVFGTVRMSPDGESLLDTYEVLLGHKPAASRPQHCPYDEDGCGQEFVAGAGCYVCRCAKRLPLFSTDALRIHEGMQPFGSNGAMFAEIMQVWERVWLIHILRTLEAKNWLTSLRRLAIVLDGPLAVFGHPAWLSHAIYRELSRINTKAKEANNGLDLLIVGVEKTGAFVEHFEQLDTYPDGGRGRIQNGSALLLSDPYIKRNIIPSTTDKPYGEDTYFGRKVLYKTASGALLVITLPYLAETHRDRSKAEPAQFPRLADGLNMLDHLVSSRYPNSLSPIVAAHSEAAIPLHLGQRVLEQMARQLLADNVGAG